MTTITLDNITQAVVSHGDGGRAHPRLHAVYASLTRHLHAFVQETHLSEAELRLGREFLARVARPRPEMPGGEIQMLTDLLGLSELVELMHAAEHAPEAGAATEGNLEGPLYKPGAPRRGFGDALGIDPAGEPLFLSGRVLDTAGRPVAGAIIEVWQANSRGVYDTQEPQVQPLGNFRGCFRTQADGAYAFQTVVPGEYTIPADGPCGEVLHLLGRGTWRAAHIHFKFEAPGYLPLTTMLYIDGTPHLDDDTVFSVKTALLTLHRHPSSSSVGTYCTAEFDFVLQPEPGL